MTTISRLHCFLANAAARMPRPLIATAQIVAALALAVLVTACDKHH
jgi:hypothetical protein